MFIFRVRNCKDVWNNCYNFIGVNGRYVTFLVSNQIWIYIKFYNNISLIQTIVVFIDLLISIFKKCINYWKNNETLVIWNFLVWYLSFWFLISTYQAHFLMQIKNWCLSYTLKFNFPNPFSNFVTLVVIFINMNKYFYYHWKNKQIYTYVNI